MGRLHDLANHLRSEAADRDAKAVADLMAKKASLQQQRQALTSDTPTFIDALKLQSLDTRLAELQDKLDDPGESVAERMEHAIATALDLVNRRLADVDSLAGQLAAVLDGVPLVVPIVDDVCPRCSPQLQLALTADSQLACPRCGYSQRYLDATAAAMSYGTDVEYTSVMYKRIGHMRKHMEHYQGKVVTHIPPVLLREVVSMVMARFEVSGVADVQLWMIRPALKDLDRKYKDERNTLDAVNYREYYKFYVQIYTLLTGKPAPHFEPRQEQHIYMMFKAMQVPFELFKPPRRKNFLNYTATLFKACQALHYTDHLPNFAPMKLGDKQESADLLMRRMFEYNGWEWIPTPRACKKKK